MTRNGQNSRPAETDPYVDKSEISPPIACVWCGECLHINVILFCCTIVFVTIYAVLLQNIFCCDLRTFVWRKFNQKLHMWWKMTNMGYGLLLPRVWNYTRLNYWRTWVGSRDAWRAWTRWLIYTDTRLKTTFWLFMDKTSLQGSLQKITYLLLGKFEMYLNTKLAANTQQCSSLLLLLAP